jgi:hypothetical protein
MQFIRIAEKDWETVWWELVSSGPISRVTKDHVYAISDRQRRMLEKKELPSNWFLLPPMAQRRKAFR